MLREAAAATDNKPARSWAKHTTRRTHTSYRLTLELSGGEAVRLERVVRPEAHRLEARKWDLGQIGALWPL
jgi:hypothetical protein